MKSDFELFPGKNLSNVFKDIYDNQKNKQYKISELIAEIRKSIRHINDWVVIGPLVKDLVDTSVRNDESLIKLATIAQRLSAASYSQNGDDVNGILSDKEKEQLLSALDEVAHDIKVADVVDDIEDQVNALQKKTKK